MSRLLQIRRPLSFECEAVQESNAKFDKNSGQVYTEVTVKGRRVGADWAWKSRGSPKISKYFHREGAPSLESTAMRSVLANIGGITAEVLKTVPWYIGRRIWKSIQQSDLDSFRAWQTFALAYQEEGESSLLYRRQSIRDPSIALEQYIKTITSQTISWLTYLTILTGVASRAELIKISNLVNLGVLDIVQPTYIQANTSALDDSVVRAWSCAAAEGEALTKLRVLIIRNNAGITARSFEYLNCFPALTLYMISNCSVGISDTGRAKSLGWRYETGEELIKTLLGDRGKKKGRALSLKDPIHACFCRAEDLNINGSGLAQIGKTDSVHAQPVLNFHIGRTAGGDLPTELKIEEMLCYQRQPSEVDGAPSDASLKRPNPREIMTGSQLAKRRKFRVSKNQNFEDLLMGFGQINGLDMAGI